jgi:ethanolamine transporter EutH
MIIMLLPPNWVFILYTLTSVASPLIPSLISQNQNVLSLNLPLCCHNSLPYIMGFDIKVYPKEFKLHACTRHIIIIVIISIIAVLTLWHSIMSCTTLILYYHTSMVIPHTSIMCTSVAVDVILGRVECTCSTSLNCDMT